jgi:hypothetical protein
LRNDESATKEQDGAIQEDFEALGIAKVESRHGDIPTESNGGAGE